MVSEIVYSCDSHVVEGPEVFDGLVEKYGDRAPRVVDGWKGREGVYLAWPLDRFCHARWDASGSPERTSTCPRPRKRCSAAGT